MIKLAWDIGIVDQWKPMPQSSFIFFLVLTIVQLGGKSIEFGVTLTWRYISALEVTCKALSKSLNLCEFKFPFCKNKI